MAFQHDKYISSKIYLMCALATEFSRGEQELHLYENQCKTKQF